MVDNFDNGKRGVLGNESLFVHGLTISEESELDLNGLLLYVEGDVESILDDWIADGRLFDSTLASGLLNAVYVMEDDWTVIVPEPATIGVLLIGGFVLIRWARKIKV